MNQTPLIIETLQSLSNNPPIAIKETFVSNGRAIAFLTHNKKIGSLHECYCLFDITTKEGIGLGVLENSSLWYVVGCYEEKEVYEKNKVFFDRYRINDFAVSSKKNPFFSDDGWTIAIKFNKDSKLHDLIKGFVHSSENRDIFLLADSTTLYPLISDAFPDFPVPIRVSHGSDLAIISTKKAVPQTVLFHFLNLLFTKKYIDADFMIKILQLNAIKQGLNLLQSLADHDLICLMNADLLTICNASRGKTANKVFFAVADFFEKGTGITTLGNKTVIEAIRQLKEPLADALLADHIIAVEKTLNLAVEYKDFSAKLIACVSAYRKIAEQRALADYSPAASAPPLTQSVAKELISLYPQVKQPIPSAPPLTQSVAKELIPSYLQVEQPIPSAPRLETSAEVLKILAAKSIDLKQSMPVSEIPIKEKAEVKAETVVATTNEVEELVWPEVSNQPNETEEPSSKQQLAA